MVKVQRIEFQVDMSKGELPFRTYASSRPVKGKLFALVSKLNADNNVFFQLYLLDAQTGGTNLIRETTVTQDEFTNIVQAIEDDIKTVDSNVEFKVQHGQQIALTNEGLVEDDNFEDVASFVAGVMTKQITKDEATDIFMAFPREKKIMALRGFAAVGGGPIMGPLNKLMGKLEGIECDCPNCAPEKHQNKVHPSNRISKYL
jgi:hypothetical protein